MWTYNSKTGVLDHDGVVIDKDCYSGHGDGLNNPDKEDVKMVGPTPHGEYQIGTAFTHKVKGKLSMYLHPDVETRKLIVKDGRDPTSFMMHGDSIKNAGLKLASEGCIIAKWDTRVAVSSSADRNLRVI